MENQKNMIATALEAAQKPFIDTLPDGDPIIFYPYEDGSWRWEIKPNHRSARARKRGKVSLHDAASLIKYVKKHKQPGTAVYINANYKSGVIDVNAVINGDTAEAADWGDHAAVYTPIKTTAAERWLRGNKQAMKQAEFAAHLTNCARDIVSKNPANDSASYPSAAEVLDFALNLEYTEKTTFKQGYREQDGRINFTFTSEDAGKTETNLKAFERFAIAFTPFQGGDPYFVEALLKFRIDKNSGALVLWYELQQVENVIERACTDIANHLQQAFADIDIYYGTPQYID